MIHSRVIAALVVAATPAVAGPLLPQEDITWLSAFAADVIEASRVAPGEKVGDIGPNTSGGPLIRPGGRGAYPAFWIRDYAMSLDCGIIPAAEQRHLLLHTAAYQQDELLELMTGSVVPPGSIPDHISFDGKPIFFPGVLDDYEKQGGPRWGKLPSLDDQFYFIHMAAEYVGQCGERAVLAEKVKNIPLLDRLERAYRMPPSRPNGLVFAEVDRRGVNFGFFDTTVHTGELLFASLLKWQAAMELVQLTGDPARGQAYRQEAEAIAEAVRVTFPRKDGWLRASTGMSGQPDVWGTAFAVCLGVLDAQQQQRAAMALAQACKAGTITWRGQIRHVPTDLDFSDSSSWEKSYVPKNTYQNGAYWATATGWVCRAVATVDETAASQLAGEYIAALRADDFRKGDTYGAPWECMHPEGNHRQNPVYMTSVTVPLAILGKTELLPGELNRSVK
ncbi:MAG: hypothetical protein IT368_14560 [Candidatus Hydrogenedentes bacterium]|nr:hypothetical protein [Candidatus Hydrogenedentota bacterium]